MSKARGIAAERELKNYFDDRGYRTIRSAGSRSPVDIVVSRYFSQFGPVTMGIQVKSTRKEILLLSRSVIMELINYSMKSGFEPVLAVRFGKKRWRVWRGGDWLEQDDSDFSKLLDRDEKRYCVFSVKDKTGKHLEDAFKL